MRTGEPAPSDPDLGRVSENPVMGTRQTFSVAGAADALTPSFTVTRPWGRQGAAGQLSRRSVLGSAAGRGACPELRLAGSEPVPPAEAGFARASSPKADDEWGVVGRARLLRNA